MIPWREVGRATVAGEDAPLVLLQHDREFVIRIGPHALMGSAAHGSEEVLAEIALAPLAARGSARVLIGGLGMGFTLAAALRQLPPGATVIVSELFTAVVGWNRGPLAHLAGRPLEDPRVTVREGDVAVAIREQTAVFDAILLDVDNGPSSLISTVNARLYSAAGLACAMRALRPGGVLAVWSAAEDTVFAKRLARAGFATRIERPRTRPGGGARHVVWLARKRASA